MYIRRKKYPFGNIGIIVVEKVNGKMKELTTISGKISGRSDLLFGYCIRKDTIYF